MQQSLGVALVQVSWQGWCTIGVLCVTFALSVLTRFPPDIIFIGGLVVLLVSGVLDVADALSGFSNAGMVTVAVLYIVVTGLQQTGALTWVSQRALGLPAGVLRALVRLMPPVMAMSAFLNNTPVVAMLIPVVTEWSRKLRISPSKLMIPLSYAAIFGGICTLIGTSTNLVVNGMLIAETDHPGLRMFDVTLVGLPCAIAGVLYMLCVGRFLLPERVAAVREESDPREYTVEMVVAAGSPLAGQTIEKAGLRHLPGLYLMEIDRQGTVLPAVAPTEQLREADRLIFVGVVDSIVDLQRFPGLVPATDQLFKMDGPRSERCLVEAVVSNTCPLVGRSVRAGNFRNTYHAVVLAVARNGERINAKIGDIVLRPGDALLLEAHSSFIDRQRMSRDFYLVSGIPDSEPLRRERASMAAAILAGMVLLAATGWTSMLKAAMVAAGLMIVTGCCSIDRARRSIEWQVLMVIAAALGIGKALYVTGAAQMIAQTFMSFAGGDPLLVLAMVYVATIFFTEVITNNAAAALVFPIALAAAADLGVSIMPFVMVIMIGASASFSSPIGYQTNLMVYAPGGYRFTDFMRVGLPLNLLFGVIAVVVAPLVYPF